MRKAFLVGALVLGACGNTPEGDDMPRGEAIEIVEASQDAPVPEPILQPIAFGDIEMAEAFGFSCAFFAESAPEEVVALAMRDMGFLKIAGIMERHAADKGSGETVAGSWRNYDGTALSFTLEIEGEGTSSGPETTRYPASLQIRDASERSVYDAAGVAECGV